MKGRELNTSHSVNETNHKVHSSVSNDKANFRVERLNKSIINGISVKIQVYLQIN